MTEEEYLELNENIDEYLSTGKCKYSELYNKIYKLVEQFESLGISIPEIYIHGEEASIQMRSFMDIHNLLMYLNEEFNDPFIRHSMYPNMKYNNTEGPIIKISDEIPYSYINPLE